MIKKIAQTLIVLTFTANCSALPIVNADALVSGDNNAIIDTDTGIKWLDFGINNGSSFNSVINSLSTTYQGWRLPTESEVRNLWSKLTAIDSADQYQIFSLWGANKTPQDHLPFLSWGYFIDNNGYLGHGSFMETGTVLASFGSGKYYQDGSIIGGVSAGSGVKYDGSNYYQFSADGNDEISTLLVKDDTHSSTLSTEVPEPSMLTLLVLSLIGVSLSRRAR